MKVQLVGVEVSCGISKKTGREYSIGSLHCLAALAPPLENGDPKRPNVARGMAAIKRDCPEPLARKLQELPPMTWVDLDETEQIRFGEVQRVITDVRPIEVVTKKVA